MLIKCKQGHGQKLPLDKLIREEYSIIFYGDTPEDIQHGLQLYQTEQFAFQAEGQAGVLFGTYQKASYGSSHQHDATKLLHQNQKLGQGTISIPGLGKVLKHSGLVKNEYFVALAYTRNKVIPLDKKQHIHGQKQCEWLTNMATHPPHSPAPGERKSLMMLNIITLFNSRLARMRNAF